MMQITFIATSSPYECLNILCTLPWMCRHFFRAFFNNFFTEKNQGNTLIYFVDSAAAVACAMRAEQLLKWNQRNA